MEEENREEKGHHFNNSSSTPTTMSFSDEILSPNMSTNNINHLSFPFEPVDIYDDPKFSSSFGFMDLLSINDYNPSLFDDNWLPTVTPEAATPVSHPLPSPASSNVQNTPASPISYNSNSSSLNEVTANNKNEQLSGKIEEEARDEGGDGSKRDDEDEDKSENQVKPRRKKQRDPKFAFVMKYPKDNLDDGYKWRKYGQKAVKNSPFPRSYYRCTTFRCPVKKRVERSSDNLYVVVTTYQGKHTHPARVKSRAPSLSFVHGTGSGSGGNSDGSGGNSDGSGSGGTIGSQQFLLPTHNYHQFDNFQQAIDLLYNSGPPLSNYMNVTSSFGNFAQDHENHGGFGLSDMSVYEPSSRGSGLLEDILMQSQMMRTKERGLN